MGRIIDGILQGVTFDPARWTGGEIEPDIIILHDTASRLGRGSAARYLKSNDRKVSVHFVIERDGTITQQVRTDRRANHAGTSTYHGRRNCNRFSIGIEMVNPGKMTRRSDDKAQAWFGQTFGIADHGIQEISTPEHGHGLWMPYTEAQIASVIDLCQALFNDIASLRDITTHWYVSPGRKVDPGPLFPLEQLRSIIFGRDEPRDVDAAVDTVLYSAGLEYVQTHTPGDTLNLRRWPSFNPNVIATIPHDTILPVLRRGVFAGRQWVCVLYGGREGWVLASYADPVTFKEASP